MLDETTGSWVQGTKTNLRVGDTIRALGSGWIFRILPTLVQGEITSFDKDGDPWFNWVEPDGTVTSLCSCADRCEVFVPEDLSPKMVPKSPAGLTDREFSQMMVETRCHQALLGQIGKARREGRILDAFSMECELGNYSKVFPR